MAAAMQHRALDGQDIFLENNVGLGHLSMQLSPESIYEKQPLQYKNWIVVLDGRFFYRESLLKQLKIPPSDYPTTPDSILLIKAFEKWEKSLRILALFIYISFERECMITIKSLK